MKVISLMSKAIIIENNDIQLVSKMPIKAPVQQAVSEMPVMCHWQRHDARNARRLWPPAENCLLRPARPLLLNDTESIENSIQMFSALNQRMRLEYFNSDRNCAYVMAWPLGNRLDHHRPTFRVDKLAQSNMLFLARAFVKIFLLIVFRRRSEALRFSS